MSIRWWELWSPGLQAVGGVVELAGAGLLAYEWWRSTQEAESLAEAKRRELMRLNPEEKKKTAAIYA